VIPCVTLLSLSTHLKGPVMSSYLPTKAYSDKLPKAVSILPLTEGSLIFSFQSGYAKGFSEGYLAASREAMQGAKRDSLTKGV